MTRHYLRFFVLMLTLLIAAPLTAYAQTPEPESSPEVIEGPAITIEGQVSNATPGGSVPPNLPLMLHAYDGMHMADMLHGTADEQGGFRFENVATAPGRSFAVMVTHDEVTYVSERIEPQAGETHLYLPVSIHDTTTDPKTIQVEQQHLLLEFKPETLHVTQLYILSNLGDRAVVDGGENNLRFRLPAGATDVSFERDEEGKRFVLLDNGFADTAPVAPGRSTQAIMVNYALPYIDKDPIELEIPVDYPTPQTAILLPEVGVTLDESEWMAGEELLIRDSVHQVYSYREGALAPGESLHLVVAGRPHLVETGNSDSEPASLAAVEVPARDSRRTIFVLGVTLSLALIGSGTIWWWRDRRQANSPVTAVDDSELEALQSVLQAIAELDEAHEAGDIDEAEYQQRRADLRDRAVTLMMAQEAGKS